MEQKIKVKPNQSFLDVILQGCGTLEAGIQMAGDNNLPVSFLPIVDSSMVISESAIAKGNIRVLKYLRQNGITIGTKGDLSSSFLITEGGDDIITEDGTDPLIEES